MNPEVPDQDQMKIQFQEELNRWFESRGILADMRSHLRHLMISALQNTQLGLKPNDRTSPKSQALNLLVAEYLLRHKSYYTLSVFTSEVPTLINFSCVNPSTVLRGKNYGELERKKPIQRYSFQENELEDIFNAMGLSTCAEELERTKTNYLDKNNEISLLELLLQTILEVATKLQVRKSLESCEVEEGKRLLSKKWSSRIADILLSEKIKPFQVTAIEEAIFRITENEMKRILEEERRLQTRILLEREKKLQEYLKRHDNEIFEKLKEAEKDLARRTTVVEEELEKRQKELCILAMEWNEKQEEIATISRNCHELEKENDELKSKVGELKDENEELKKKGEKQKEEVDLLKEEMNSLINKLKEMTESNDNLSKRLEMLVKRENKEVSINHDQPKQLQVEKTEESVSKFPLVISKNKENGFSKNTIVSLEKEYEQSQPIGGDTSFKVSSTEMQHQTSSICTEVRKNEKIQIGSISDNENEVTTPSSSSTEEVLVNVRKKLEYLEEESNKINQKYLEYKSKYRSADSDSETSKNSPQSVRTPATKEKSEVSLVVKETKFSQTEIGSHFEQINSLIKSAEKSKTDLDAPISSINSKKTSEETFPIIQIREPTKRQLLNREYFLKSRLLLQEFQKKNIENQLSPPSKSDSFLQVLTSGSSSEDFEKNTSKYSRKSAIQKSQEDLVMLTPLRTASFYCNELPKIQKSDSVESVRKSDREGRNSLKKEDIQCLELLEKTRIKSPKEEVSKPVVNLRQQVLLMESEDEKSETSTGNSSRSGSSSKVSVGQDNGSDAFW